MNGDFGLIYKSQLLNSAVRVPLIVRPPKGAIESQGAINDSPAEWMDVGATLCEMGGTRAVGFSQSLLPGTADVTHHHRTGAISEMNGEVMWLDVDHKAVLNTDGEVYLLFDRHSDPDEQDNLAGTSRAADDENRLRLRILERLMQTQVRA
jgi:choline-sulfatase